MSFDPTSVRILHAYGKSRTDTVVYKGVVINKGDRPQDQMFALNVANHLVGECGVVHNTHNNMTTFTKAA